MADHARPGENGADTDAPLDSGRTIDDADPVDRAGEDRQGPADAINAVRGLVEQVLEEGLSRVKGEGGKLGSRASQTMSGMLSEFGVAQRRDHEDLELRIAQLEHRVRLLEGQRDANPDAVSASEAAGGAADDESAEAATSAADD